MRITGVDITPLLLRYRQSYHWAQGSFNDAGVVLVAVHTDEGVTGYGECAGPPAEAIASVLREARSVVVGRSAFDIAAIAAEVEQVCFVGAGANMPRFTNRVVGGLEMALWDVVGKANDLPVHKLLGGAVHESIGYFGFLQGETTEELTQHATELLEQGCPIIYLKVGRGEAEDMRNTEAVRAIIGSRRLRLDANEVWDPLSAINMINKLARFEPEFIEQPTASHSVAALAQVKASVSVPIAADQCVHTPAEVYEICMRQAADLVVVGLHETGGILGLKRAAAIAEAAGISICLHGVRESGITTCASNQAAATIANMDDGNQIMCQLLERDIVTAPELSLKQGRLPVINRPGLGFELDHEFIAECANAAATKHPE